MINLHAIANRVLKMVHPNEDFIAIRCTGYMNNNGALIHSYGSCELDSAQMQSLNGDEQQLSNEIMQNELSRKLFISVKGTPLTAGRIDTQEGASFLYQTRTGQFWKVFNISEDFTKNNWATVFISLVPPESTPDAVVKALKDSNFGYLFAASHSAQSEFTNGYDSTDL